MLKSLLIGALSMPSFCISRLCSSSPVSLIGKGANFRTYSTTVRLSFKEILFLVFLLE